ncbi:hypothetical protein [Flavobacterium humi]|uniref:Uncharacterized protein n=1 Tax=Flavobacterium humi TaxID=2562683 RepID=A0A4Z0L5Q2_9FLAO|nr:hypothetical protein [Flavobacterium humi]TGD57030.1 hypothetical protein E4635_12740 [Flavobacterium humi]
MSNSAFLETEERKAYSQNTKNHVPVEEIEVKTTPMSLTVGISPDSLAIPRPDLAGLRLTSLKGGPVYLVNPEGYLQMIPNPQTYNSLFRDWSNIIKADLLNIATGSPITDGAVLAKADNSAAVYIVSNGVKRWINSAAAMDKYYFNWDAILTVPHVLVDFIPSGQTWS